MKCLIISDSHGNSLGVRKIINLHRDAEVVFFLGDGLCDLEQYENDKTRAILAVRGNWDEYGGFFGDVMCKKTDSINLLGRRIVFTHGDLYGAKYGLDGLKKLAEDTKADILLFGHTHQRLEKYIPTDDGGYYLFNPGSAGAGYGKSASYGLLTITEKDILFSHGTL